MGQLADLTDFFPSAWMDRGVLFIQASGAQAKKVAKAVLRNGRVLAATSAVVALSGLVMPHATAASWPPTPQERELNKTHDAISSIFSRIDAKLAGFLVPDPTIDDALLAEARQTISSKASRNRE